MQVPSGVPAMAPSRMRTSATVPLGITRQPTRVSFAGAPCFAAHAFTFGTPCITTRSTSFFDKRSLVASAIGFDALASHGHSVSLPHGFGGDGGDGGSA